jgi:hypothetical protein
LIGWSFKNLKKKKTPQKEKKRDLLLLLLHRGQQKYIYRSELRQTDGVSAATLQIFRVTSEHRKIYYLLRLSVRILRAFVRAGGSSFEIFWVELFGLFSERCRRRLLKLRASNRNQSRNNNFYFFWPYCCCCCCCCWFHLGSCSSFFVFCVLA